MSVTQVHYFFFWHSEKLNVLLDSKVVTETKKLKVIMLLIQSLVIIKVSRGYK